MMDAPTSEITPPNPAMTAARRGSLGLLDQDPDHLETGGAEGQDLKPEFWGKLLDGGQGDAHHDGRCDDRLCDDHGQRRVEDPQKPQGPVSPEKDRDEETHDHRRKPHPRVDEAHDNLLPGKPGEGHTSPDRYPDEQTDQRGGS